MLFVTLLTSDIFAISEHSTLLPLSLLDAVDILLRHFETLCLLLVIQGGVSSTGTPMVLEKLYTFLECGLTKMLCWGKGQLPKPRAERDHIRSKVLFCSSERGMLSQSTQQVTCQERDWFLLLHCAFLLG